MLRPKLDLQLDSQKVNYELVDVLKLIIYNLGFRKSLDVIPRKLIEEYFEELN